MGQGGMGVIFSRYLNGAGEPATSPAMASYLVTVHDASSLSKSQLEYEARSLRRGGSHWCHGAINPRYIANQLTKASYLLKLEALNSRTGATMQLGFASLINKGHGVLYIDLICAQVTERVRASARLGAGGAGGLLMKQIVAFAQQPAHAFSKLKLSALPYVFRFYDKLGFRLDATPDVYPDDPLLLNKIRDTLRSYKFRSDEEFDIALKMSELFDEVQPRGSGVPKLTDEQEDKLMKLIRAKIVVGLIARKQWSLIDYAKELYERGIKDPVSARLLYLDVKALEGLGLAPGGLGNGISMVYDVPPAPAQGGSAANRRRKTRRGRRRGKRSHTRKSG